MGLSKRLVPEQISFESVGSGGSSGWQAPEQLISRSGGTARQTNSGKLFACDKRVDLRIRRASWLAHKMLPFGGAYHLHALSITARPAPTNAPDCFAAVDVFSFGLLLHYCLTAGQHPFGELYERDANILQRRLNFKHIQHLPEAVNLIRGCCEPQGV